MRLPLPFTRDTVLELVSLEWKNEIDCTFDATPLLMLSYINIVWFRA